MHTPTQVEAATGTRQWWKKHRNPLKKALQHYHFTKLSCEVTVGCSLKQKLASTHYKWNKGKVQKLGDLLLFSFEVKYFLRLRAKQDTLITMFPYSLFSPFFFFLKSISRGKTCFL